MVLVGNSSFSSPDARRGKGGACGDGSRSGQEPGPASPTFFEFFQTGSFTKKCHASEKTRKRLGKPGRAMVLLIPGRRHGRP